MKAFRLLEAYFLVDKLEQVLTDIDPIRNLKKSEDIVAFSSMLTKCISMRKYLNKKYDDDHIMNQFDKLGDQLTEAFKKAYNN